MKQRFFFASHSIDALGKKLSERLENDVQLFSPPLIVIPHPSMKEWLQKVLCTSHSRKSIVGLEFVSWKEAIQRLFSPLPVPSNIELSAALYCHLAEKQIVDELEKDFARAIEGFSFKETPEALHEKQIYEEILQAFHWKSYPNALEKMPLSKRGVILFAIDFMPPAIYQFFLRFSYLEVYQFSPCAMFWQDFCSIAQKKWILQGWNQKGATLQQLQSLEDFLRDSHPLLANWGMIGRKMNSLSEEDAETNYELLDCKTALHALQFDLLFLEKPSFASSSNDASIQCVRTGATLLEEVQWVHEEIERLAESGVEFSQIRVYAPDITLYAPIIQFIFEQVPFRISGMEVASGFNQVMQQIFQCVAGRWEADYIFELFQRPCFYKKRKWQKEEIQRIREWMEIGGVRWGLDLSHKQETTDVKSSFSEQGSWEEGWNKMLDALLYFRPENEKSMSWEETDLFDSFFEAFRALQKIVLSWKEPRTLSIWAQEIEDLMNWALECDDAIEEDVNAKRFFCKMIEALRKTSKKFSTQLFPFSWIASHFITSMKEEGSGSLLQAVRCSTLTLGASLPAKVIFLLGMDEEAFPRVSSGSSQRILKDAPTLGDCDRYLFLQTLFNAKERLIISYGNSSKEDGKTVSASLLVQELFSYLDSAFSFSDGKKASELFIIDAEISKPIYKKRGSLIANSEKLPEISSSRKISIQELSQFFSHPPKYYLKEVLGIEFPSEEASVWKEFEMPIYSRHMLLTPKMREKIKTPLGMFGQLSRKQLDQETYQLHENLQSMGQSVDSISTLHLRGTLTGEILHVVPTGVLHFSADDIGGLFRKWPQIVAALSMTQTNQIFCLKSGKVKNIKNPSRAEQLMIDFFLRYQQSFCFLHAEWADSVLRKQKAPEMNLIKDPIFRWILKRSSNFDMEREINLWKDVFAETFSELIDLFPVRGQYAEV